MGFLQRHKKKLAVLVGFLVAVPAAHVIIGKTTTIHPPTVALASDPLARGADGIDRAGSSYTRVRAGVREVYLEGDAERLGAMHARLLRDRMAANESVLWGDFEKYVPLSPVRALLMDISRVRYRHVDRGMPEPRRRELAAEALAFERDPYSGTLPTFHRLVFLHALYDIALSFEHSPLIGCSAFALGPNATRDGHPLYARAFDFEAGEVFDRDKAVFFVRGAGAIPYASVAWPGLTGVVTGMNLEGVFISVNGARAGDPQAEGLPVVFSLREVLERAKDTREAIAILREQRVMVSHLVFVGDANGAVAIVERSPGAEAHVREAFADKDRIGLTNHFEGPQSEDEKNAKVKRETSTIARRTRLDQLLAAVGDKEATPLRAVAMLRDHTCAGDASCPLGDRRAIDAIIATHGVVADAQERSLWVSAGPHLSGKFVRFDLRTIFGEGHDPAKDAAPETIDEDPILFDGRYEIGRARAAGTMKEGGSR
jgi:isopenicillin-N N-acyltransferase-like protein